MASLIMATVNIGVSASSLSGVRVSGVTSRNAVNDVVSLKMSPVRCQAKSEAELIQRRALVAGSAAAVLALLSSAPVQAEEEAPKNGSKEARKKYKSICVTMPTASVCHG